MKISAGAAVALCAVSAHAFSVTMSSYLETMTRSGAGLTSFTPANGNAYVTPVSWAPAPSVPAPAPPTYVSPLANLPANSDLNYLKTIGGGNAMKRGPNYSGVNTSFKSTPSTLFTPASANPTSYASPPAPAPYAPSTNSAPAGASNASYMSALGGGSAMKAGKNYSGVSTSWKTSSTPYVVSPVESTPATSEASPLNYMSSLGGGSAMKAGTNYSGMKVSWKTSSASTSSVQTPSAPPATVSAEPAGAGPLTYMSSLGGGSAMKTGKNYSGMKVSWKTSAVSSTAGSTPSAPPAMFTDSAEPAVAGPLNYVASLGGGSAMKAGKNYSGMKVTWKLPRSSSTASAPAQDAAISEPAAVAGPLNYMSSLGGGSAMKSGKNYSGMNVSWKSPASSYTTSAPASAPASSIVSAEQLDSGAGPLNYMTSLGGGSAMKAGKNYSGMNVSWKSYTSSATVIAPVSAPASHSVSSEPGISDAGPLNYMSSLGGGSAMKSGKNYSGMKVSWKSSASSFTVSAPASAPASTYTETTESVAAGPLNYMSSLGGGSAMKAGKNYSGMKVSWKSSGSFTVSAPAPAPATYTASDEPVVSVPLNYMSSLGGGSAMKAGKNYSGMKVSWKSSSSYTVSAPASAPAPYAVNDESAAAGPLNYMSTLGGGSAMKAGKNYSGMNVSWKSTSRRTEYAGEPASIASKPVADAAAASPLNYISALGGGSAMKPGKNFSGVSRSFKLTQNSGWTPPQATSPTAAPYTASSEVASGGASTLSYVAALGGGSAMKPGKNFSGVSRSFKAGASTGWTPPPVASQAAAYAPAPAPAVYAPFSAPELSGSGLNYMAALGGGSAMKSGPNYSGVSSSFKNGRSNGYASPPPVSAPVNGYSLPSYNGAPAPYQSSFEASPPSSAPASYTSFFGQRTAPKSYAFAGKKHAPAGSGMKSYLDAV